MTDAFNYFQAFGIDPSLVPPTLRGKMDDWAFAKKRERYEGSLRDFVRDVWPWIDSSEYLSCWAIDAVCEHLEAVTEGEILRLLINQPPRTAKTTITSICWPAWTWARSDISFLSGPQVRFLCASYNERLSFMNANKSRRLLLSPFFKQYWGERFSLTQDQNNKSQFDNTKGGSRLSTSVGGSLLGLGGDIINVDDPHNTETERVIETDADRNKVESWSKELFSTRLNDPKRSAIVVNMQRLHEEDLSGLILKSREEHGEEWTNLCIPMEYDSGRSYVTVILPGQDEEWNDPRTREGELMWPERFGPAEVKRLKDNLGPYLASGRLQQLPVPKGGGILQREWWKLWDDETAQRYGVEWHGARKEFPVMDLIVASLDTSYGEKEENDYNALTIWGIFQDKGKNRRAMLMYGWQKRLKLHGIQVDALPGESKIEYDIRRKEEWGLVEWVSDTCKRYRVNRVLIENKTRGKDIADEIKKLNAREQWDVWLLEPSGDKVSRGHSVVPLFTDGSVWAPDTAWSEIILQQCATVPKAAHDDLYDTVTQFLRWARENGLLVRGEEMNAALEDKMQYLPPAQTVAQQYGV